MSVVSALPNPAMPRAAKQPQLPLRAALQPLQFAGWGGAIDLMRLLLEGLTAMPEHFAEVCLLTPRTSISRKLKTLFFAQPKASVAIDRSLDFAADMKGASSLKSVNFNKRHLANALRRQGIDFYISSMTSLGPRSSTPWVCYIYDFQHRHYPQYFSGEEIQSRDRQFAKLLREAPLILANSKSVIADASKFFPDYAGKLHSLPFAPLLREEWLGYNIHAEKAKYGISGEYFITCNQFWAHKNHETAFRALRILLESVDDVSLICTGDLEDYRNPQHKHYIFKAIAKLDLSTNVRLLGHIPKSDQIALMRGAKAVIQPTLFEGGPGGGSGYEAIALGVPLLLSDIAVNREIDEADHVYFFKTSDADELARLMARQLSEEFTPNKSELLKKSDARRKQLSQFLFDLAHLVKLTQAQSSKYLHA
jgi:glycosyltransferase involved in cell wall biosynthesis